MILDAHDPSGLGVFSKTGRQLTQKMPILAKRKIPHQQHFDYSHILNPQDTHLFQANRTLSRKPEPFSVSLTREKRNNERGKYHYPVVGQYNYSLSQRPHLVIDYLDAYKRSQRNAENIQHRRKKTMNTNIQIPFFESFESSTLNRSVGHINMSKMLGRSESSARQAFKNSIQYDQSAEGTLDSKMQIDQKIRASKRCVIGFQKQLSREQVSKKPEVSRLCYDYDYKYIKNDLGKIGPPFSKLTRRKQLLNPTYTLSTSKYDYDEYVWKQNSSIYPKTRVGNIDFSRQTSRYHQRMTDN